MVMDLNERALRKVIVGLGGRLDGGPFANIAHGCNSVQATRLDLKTADYLVTEAGVGADLGASFALSRVHSKI